MAAFDHGLLYCVSFTFAFRFSIDFPRLTLQLDEIDLPVSALTSSPVTHDTASTVGPVKLQVTVTVTMLTMK